MNPKKALRDLEKQLRKQPSSLVVRIRLAAVLHVLGRLPEAVDLYRSVAMAYFAQGRLDQAIAVCHSLLEIAPMHQDTHLLLAELDSHRQRRGDAVGPPGDDGFGAAGPGWPMPRNGDPMAPPGADPMGGVPMRRDTGQMSRRDTGPAVWRESGQFFRRDTPDPVASFGPPVPPGAPPGTAPPPVREGSVTSRLPLPVVRTVPGLVPPPDGRVRGGSVPPPPRGRQRPPSLPLPPTAAGRPDARDADDDAPTHIADRWVNPLAPNPMDVGRASAGAGAGGMQIPRARPTSATEIHTNPRRPLGSGRLPTFRARPRRKLVGSGAEGPPVAGEPAEPTEYDDGLELARAFGRAYSVGEESGVEAASKLPLLSGLSERSVDAIAAGMVRRRIGSGEMIVRDGEAGDSCFVLAHGEARVLKRDPLLPRGDLVEVSRLGDGDLFGEVAMLGDRRRHASVQAVSDCDLLEIPRAHLVLVSRRFPEVDSFMQQFYRERLIATLVSTASFFRPLDVPQRTSLLSHFRFSHVEAGTLIVGEGERAGGFFLIVLGAVEITKRVSERRQVLLATLGEGTYFGEMSLLRGEVARASVTATDSAELAVLPAKNFYALVANHPVLWDQVRQEAHRRELEMVQIVTGVTGTV
ncbi:MAG TPA: cyclic nucleotide-binding domain-containing protein [Kofleriaceae bacterium]|nr:cyclic nucleotide-binding domain-containing protein [Kofleriaceae bacterium]